MAVSRTLGRKAPTQQGDKFYLCEQQGGPHGKPTHQPERPASMPIREKIHGNPKLNKSQT